MAEQALYRRYRSTSFTDIHGQDHIVKPLQQAIEAGRVSHAYLLSGPRGVGKTSVARIIAHEINNLNYSLGEMPIDIIEIDAASNRRIDEIRDLRDKVHIAPVSADYKVYIIDEVHMLTKEAFNALLKTLEEPPQHVVFILATTEAHKLPSTIISRTQRHNFKPIPEDVIVKQLQRIAKAEQLTIDEQALELLAQHGDGSFRDSISLLDQLTSEEKITQQSVRDMLGLPSAETITTLRKSVFNGDHKTINQQLQKLQKQAVAPTTVAEQLIKSIRQQQRYEVKATKTELNLIEQLLKVPTSRSPDLLLEVILHQTALTVSPKTDDKATETAQKKAPNKTAQPKKEKTDQATETKKDTAKRANAKRESIDESDWNKILSAVKKQNNALHAVLRVSEASQVDDTLHITFKYPFHSRRAGEAKNKDLLTKVVHDVFGAPLSIAISVDPDVKKSDEAGDSDPTSTILHTFGGGEVLEL